MAYDPKLIRDDAVVKRDGANILTDDWDIGDERRIILDELRIRDNSGFTITDTTGNTVAHITDSEGLFSLKQGIGIDEFSTDGTLTGDSDNAVSTEKAVKTYVDTHTTDSINTHASDADAHHAESHSIASHSDTSATGAELNSLTNNSIVNTLHRHSELVASDGSPDPALVIGATGGISTNGASLEINSLGSGNRYAYIDFVGDDTYTDWGLRIIRNNTGPDANSQIQHRGTGAFYIGTTDASLLSWTTSGATRLTIASDGNITQANGLYFATDEVRARDSGGLLLRDDSGTLGITIADGGEVSLASGPGLKEFPANENILINQDFSIWQQNITFTNPANGTYTADNWYVEKGGGGTPPTIGVSRNNLSKETGFKYCCELTISNVGVAGAGRYWDINQLIKDPIKYRGKTLTASIRIKASTTIGINGLLYLYDGVGNSTAITSVTTSWVTYTVTRTISSTATNIRLIFVLIPWSTDVISTTGSIYIQWGKVENGSVNTPVIPISDDKELIECQGIKTPIYEVNNTYTGKVMSVTVDDASAAFGNALYCASDFHYERCDADAAATMPCRALALESGSGLKKVLLEGQICNTSWNWTTGPIYVSTSTGGLGQIPPNGSGDCVQKVGWALSADTLYFRPDLTVEVV